MNRWSSGNGIIPTDAEFDAYWSSKCTDCGHRLTSAEEREGDTCFECDPRDEEGEEDDDE